MDIDVKGKIDLSAVCESVLGSMKKDKESEIHEKIRFVIFGVTAAQSRIKKAQDQIKKDEERIVKGLEKIERIRSGDWGILNSINVNEKSQEEQG